MKKKLVILICGIMVLNLTGCGKSDLEDAKRNSGKIWLGSKRNS